MSIEMQKDAVVLTWLTDINFITQSQTDYKCF